MNKRKSRAIFDQSDFPICIVRRSIFQGTGIGRGYNFVDTKQKLFRLIIQDYRLKSALTARQISY
jgi:hypothetical protein